MRVYATLMFGLLIACSSEKKAEEEDKDKGESTRRVALDVSSFCDMVVNTCGNGALTVSDCIKSFAAVRVTPDCADAIDSASCADFSPGSSVQSLCFPACNIPGGQRCNADGTMSTCGKASELIVLDCAAVCSATGKTFTGKCGPAQSAQSSGGNGQASGDQCTCS